MNNNLYTGLKPAVAASVRFGFLHIAHQAEHSVVGGV
jgi:hypothetical protein